MRFAVTTGRKSATAMADAAAAWSRELNAPLLERGSEGSVANILQKHGLDALVVATAEGPRIFSAGGSFFYHPGMAALRLQRLRNGARDHFAAALGLRPGMKILDATLGMAADAAIASYIAGSAGCVLGLEASTLLHFVVTYGLRHYEAEEEELTQALRRIRTVRMAAEDFLARCAPDSFDAVYFDPMFRYPVQGSSGMDAMRPLAWQEPLGRDAVELAVRAAPLVVIKERSEKILRGYGCTALMGGRYSRVKFGLIRR